MYITKIFVFCTKVTLFSARNNSLFDIGTIYQFNDFDVDGRAIFHSVDDRLKNTSIEERVRNILYISRKQNSCFIIYLFMKQYMQRTNLTSAQKEFNVRSKHLIDFFLI